MENIKTKFSILISTKNRINDLKYTLEKLNFILQSKEVKCTIYDDGSTDGTFQYVKDNYPKIYLYKNETSKGYLYCRNKMLNETNAKYAISLDDDANFISNNPLEEIEKYFKENLNCGVLAFRIFWSKKLPLSTLTNEKPLQVKGFVGCGHVWNVDVWKKIPNYPEWFVFYGEEEFASFQLFKINYQVHYLPSVLVHHRVDITSRRNNSDYQQRQRRSFRSGWYLYFLFYPLKLIPKKLLYTLWIQLKNKTFKGNFTATVGNFQAIIDVIVNLPRLLKNSNRLTISEYNKYVKISDVKIYWKPQNEKTN